MGIQEIGKFGQGNKVSNSLASIGFGFVLLIVGTILLWWNEGRTIKNTNMLNEAQSVAVHVDNLESIDPNINGQLIHASAMADTKEVLKDNNFGIQDIAIRLTTKVEYYQMEENKEQETNASNETIITYSYKEVWTNEPINSNDFNDNSLKKANSIITKIDSEDHIATNVNFGAYTLPDFIINQISNSSDDISINISKEIENIWNNKLLNKADSSINNKLHNDSTKIENDTNIINNNLIHVVGGNVIYLGSNPNSPKIGDVRITYTIIKPTIISIIAKVNGNTFEKFIDKNGNSFTSVSMGTISKDEMFASEHSSNGITAWLLRILGILIIIGGLRGIFSFISSILNFIPFLSSIANAGIGLICTILGIVWSLNVIAIAWIFYRPLLAVSLLAVIIALIVLLIVKGKKATKAKI